MADNRWTEVASYDGHIWSRALGCEEVAFYGDSIVNGATSAVVHAVAFASQRLLDEDRIRAAWIQTKARHPIIAARIVDVVGPIGRELRFEVHSARLASVQPSELEFITLRTTDELEALIVTRYLSGYTALTPSMGFAVRVVRILDEDALDPLRMQVHVLFCLSRTFFDAAAAARTIRTFFDALAGAHVLDVYTGVQRLLQDAQPGVDPHDHRVSTTGARPRILIGPDTGEGHPSLSRPILRYDARWTLQPQRSRRNVVYDIGIDMDLAEFGEQIGGLVPREYPTKGNGRKHSTVDIRHIDTHVRPLPLWENPKARPAFCRNRVSRRAATARATLRPSVLPRPIPFASGVQRCT